MKEIILNKNNFDDEVINSEKTVIVDFWAPWCTPCRIMGPVISKIAEKSFDKYSVGKVNVDEEPELAYSYGIMSIPAIKVFRDGKVIAQSVGVISEEKIMGMIG